MNNLHLRKVIEYSSAQLIKGKQDKIIREIVIDSREVKEAYLFIAIIGEKQDGHKYLKEAVKNGASAVIVDRNIENEFILNSGVSILKVKDTTLALQNIAHNYRKSFNKLKVIAVTGSAGKTTTKDLIYSLLSQKYNCLKTDGNYNNHIGLPLTLLRLTGTEGFAIVEMGMSALGEIELLTKIAEPDIGVITNVAAAHLKQLGSLDNIAKAKKELIDNLDDDAIAILNYDNHYTNKMIKSRNKTISFGFKSDADIQARDYNFNREKNILTFTLLYNAKNYSFKFNKAGKHNIYNVMPAVIIALEHGISRNEIQKALLNIDFSSLRMEIINLQNGAKIINDSYNANPLAVKAALNVLTELKGERKIAVLASMLELGAKSSKKHKEIGEYAGRKDLDILITIGKKARDIAVGAEKSKQIKKVVTLENNQQCIEFLKQEAKKDDLILIKGSRSNKLEEIAVALSEGL